MNEAVSDMWLVGLILSAIVAVILGVGIFFILAKIREEWE